MSRRLACLALAFLLPVAPAAAQSPGDLLDDGLNRLNRAFEELTQAPQGTAAAPTRNDGPIALTIDQTTRVWCPQDETMALIGAFAPVEADMADDGVLEITGEGGVTLAIQPGAGCALIEE